MLDAENVHPNAAVPKAKNAGKTIEQIYQKKTQLEHILLRPDTYVGAIEPQTDKMWVYNRKAEKMEFRTITYVPGLYKIFDEILVNAADNFVRDPVNMDSIKVEINQEEGSIKVWNNGKGVPIREHKEHKLMIPEMVFAHLLTSDNYDDTEKKTTGGRNGYGAKLTNIFSKKFIVETADSETKQKYRQKFENNMAKKGEPQIKSHAGSDYTEITFWPDLKKFGMAGLDDDICDLMSKRVFDIGGTSARSGKKGLKVLLNGLRLPVRNFGDYVGLYLAERTDLPRIHEVASDRWEFCVSVSEGQFNQVSFVNSINTTKGGTHVTHVADQLIAAILKKVNGKNKGGMEIKPFHVKNHLWLFVNCLIENPCFDSQTKDTMTSKQTKFGSSCTISDSVINKVLKCGIVDTVLHWAKSKENLDMKRKLKGAGMQNTTRVLGIPKLEDANEAGTKTAEMCTLILTEGDSAKSLAVAGLSVIGRNRYGVFPLKGKLLNIRDAPFKQVMANTEIQNLIKILNLDNNKKYEDGPKGLRYGSVMFMTDQDLDGSHIKGLLMNMFEHWWPNLFKHPGFLKEFTTPIVKVSKSNVTQQFFTLKEYHTWREVQNGAKGWKTKYYKGLGTSTAQEAKEYFRRIRQHELAFDYKSEKCTEAIDLAFNKKRADDRKAWINGANDEDFVDHSRGSLSYVDFVNKELVQFSKYDTHRSIPHVIDGFKPTQRKVLFGAFKRNLKSDVKVAQLVGYISEQTAYHHGEASLETTIVGMAQDYVGSNNCNLLVPSGQFGTRAQGGKDSASSRYIYTRLNKPTRAIFHPDDDAVLHYLSDEGMSIEPRFFVPVIPMILCNGGDGIGTGWSCSVPNYNPRDIIANLHRLLQHEEMEPMHPWYQGFQGSVTVSPKGGYEICGLIQKTGERTLEITELPVRSWTQDYKEFLQEMLVGNQEKEKPSKDDKKKDDGPKEEPKPEVLIEDIREFHTESTVHFEVTLTAEKMMLAESIGLEKVFKMRKTGAAITNMVLFDTNGRIKKYNDAFEIMYDFADTRIKTYHERKTHMCERLLREKVTLDEKVRFILMVINKQIVVSNRKKKDLVADLQKNNFPTRKQIDKLTLANRTVTGAPVLEEEEDEDEEETEDGKKKSDTGYNYLLGMPLWNLTHEKVENMKRQVQEKTSEFDALMETTPEQMWWTDLDAVSACLDGFDEERQKSHDKSSKLAAESRAKAKGTDAGKKAPKKLGKKAIAAPLGQPAADSDGDFSDEEKPAAAAKPKAGLPAFKVRADGGLGEAKRPVLMSLDLGTQRTLQTVTAECAREVAAQAVAQVADIPEPPSPEPTGLLARLLKSRGAALNLGGAPTSSSGDFFSSLGCSPQVPAAPVVPTPVPEPVAVVPTLDANPLKGLKRGKATGLDTSPSAPAQPTQKKARTKKAVAPVPMPTLASAPVAIDDSDEEYFVAPKRKAISESDDEIGG